MSFSQTKDQRLLAFYEGVRKQVNLDRQLNPDYRFAGPSVKQYADKLREEIDRRRLNVPEIDWS